MWVRVRCPDRTVPAASVGSPGQGRRGGPGREVRAEGTAEAGARAGVPGRTAVWDLVRTSVRAAARRRRVPDACRGIGPAPGRAGRAVACDGRWRRRARPAELRSPVPRGRRGPFPADAVHRDPASERNSTGHGRGPAENPSPGRHSQGAVAPAAAAGPARPRWEAVRIAATGVVPARRRRSASSSSRTSSGNPLVLRPGRPGESRFVRERDPRQHARIDEASILGATICLHSDRLRQRRRESTQGYERILDEIHSSSHTLAFDIAYPACGGVDRVVAGSGTWPQVRGGAAPWS